VLAASSRAVEASRPDALAVDPWAVRFVEAARDQLAPGVPVTYGEAAASAGARTWCGLSEFVAVRTRVLDDFLTEAAAAGLRQAVVLAAGLDSRAFRLDWPAGFTVYEVDRPGVLDFKARVLEAAGAVATCERRAVEADLAHDWPAALAAAGFSAAAPTAWIAEGLLAYLAPAVANALLASVRERSAPGSRVGVEHFTDLGRPAAPDSALHQAVYIFAERDRLQLPSVPVRSPETKARQPRLMPGYEAVNAHAAPAASRAA
jgi:methyltransferase (TIGR00027 family)